MGIRVLLFLCTIGVINFLSAQNVITLSLSSESYDCSSGKVSFTFHLVNMDGVGNTHYHSIYNIQAGASQLLNQSSVDEEDISFTGDYVLGTNIAITARGISNNGASLVEYDFVATSPSAPAKPSIFAPVTDLCGLSSITLTAAGSGYTYTWSTGQTGNSISVSAAGTYTVHESNFCGASAESDPIAITAGSGSVTPTISPAGPITICNANSVTLNIIGGGNTNWYKDGGLIAVNSGTLVVSDPGSYTATLNNGCGVSAQSTAVIISTSTTPPAPTLNVSGAITLCDGATQFLITSPSTNGGTIYWSNGSTGNSIIVSAAGNYYAYENNPSCGNSANSATVTITTLNKPVAPTVTPPGNQLLCNGQSATLNSTGSAITWSNGAMGNSMTTAVGGTYYSFDHNFCGNSNNSNSVVITAGTCPTPAPGTAFSICPGALKTLDAGAGYDSYVWSSGQTTQTISVGPGSYSVTVTKNGCTATSVVVTVSYYTVNIPTISVSGATTFCSGGSVTLTGSAGASYLWSNGATTNPIVVNTSGNYFVTVSDANGCQATSASTNVSVNSLASATISGTTSVCQNSTSPSVTFSASGGTAPYTFFYQINGGATQTVSTTTSSASLVVPTGTVGNFIYSLVGVQESSATSCFNPVSGSATVTVNGLPTATISGDAVVCRFSSSPLLTFTGNGGTAPYTFSYTINGGSVQTVTTTIGNSVSISAPTNAANNFVYALTGVNESSTTHCSNAAGGTATISVRILPIATISGSTIVCQNGAPPQIKFTGGLEPAPFTFTYSINGGAAQSITTTSTSNIVTLQAPTNAAGTFIYALLSVTESGAGTCSNSASGAATVVVNPLPVATISGSASVCQNDASPVVTFSGSGAVSPYTFTYSINGGANQAITTTSGNSVSVSVPTNVTGTYSYVLVGVQASGTNACGSIASGTALVVVNPQPVAAIIAAPVTHLCNGDTGQITITNWNEGYTYTWYKDGVLFTSSTGQSISVTQGGTYTVMVTSDKGCNAATVSNPIIITIGNISTPVITGYLKVCEGGKTNLDVTASNKAWPYELYRWTDTPIGDSIGNEKSFSAYAGQYRVMVEREGCYDSATVAITADDTEYPAGKLIITPNIIPYGGQVKLEAAVTGAVQFQWNLGDGGNAITFSNVFFQNFYNKKDSLQIEVIAVSDHNCKTTFTGSLKILPADSVFIPNRSWAGNLKDWNVFPNPFRYELKLSVILQRNETIRVDLFTGDGGWVQGWVLSGVKGENWFLLDKIAELKSGVMYFITAIYNGEKHFDKIYKY